MERTIETSERDHGATLRKRPAGERGRAEHGWLHARFTFSFAEYYDPEHMGFRSMHVMNNDVIEPGVGFPTHPHRDAEIFAYVISGQLEHRDSLGNGSVISAGNLQYLSAGSGVSHSEFNPSKDSPTELTKFGCGPRNAVGSRVTRKNRTAIRLAMIPSRCSSAATPRTRRTPPRSGRTRRSFSANCRPERRWRWLPTKTGRMPGCRLSTGIWRSWAKERRAVKMRPMGLAWSTAKP